MKKSLSIVFSALFIALALFFISFQPETVGPKGVGAYPEAVWVGGMDGGVYFQITEKKLPRYYVVIRYESGAIWQEGWLESKLRPLEEKDFQGYYGGDSVEIKDGVVLHFVID